MPTDGTGDDDTGGRGLGRRTLLRRVVACGGSLVGLEMVQSASAQPTTPRLQGIGSGYLSAMMRSVSEWTQLTKLVPDGKDDMNQFGRSIGLESSTALIGSTGAAFVFTKSDGNWSQEAQLIADDQDGDKFGQTVALSGTTALIGARYDEDPNGHWAGSAYVFTCSAGEWTQQAKLAADDGENKDRFGQSVAVDGDTVLIGADQGDKPGGEDDGKAYVFTRQDGNWIQDTILAVDDERADFFGSSVALDKDTAVIAARLRDQGAVYVFTRSDGDWTHQANFISSDNDPGDEFGSSVALDGDTAVVGAESAEEGQHMPVPGRMGNETGAAYVFTRSDGEWTQQAKLTADDGDVHDTFGSSVAIDGDTILVGARSDDDPHGKDAGSAYVFTRADGEWSQQTKLVADDGGEFDYFGRGAAVDHNTAIVGAYADEDPLGYFAGSAYVYWKDQKED